MRLQLLTGVSTLAVLAAFGLTPSALRAACDATAPVNGATVTCDANAPNPETDAIIAPGSTDVLVEFATDAALETTTSPAIDLGGGAYIDMAPGSSIADFDTGTIPANIAGVIDGGFSGIMTAQDLVDLFSDIRGETPVRMTPVEATIELGVTDSAVVQTAINEVSAAGAVNKAIIADRAMSAITGYIPSFAPPPPPLPGEPDATGRNIVIVDGATIASAGAAAIRSADDSALYVVISDGGSVASVTESAPAILLDGAGALDVRLHDGAIQTFFDGAAGIFADAASSVLNVIMEDDSRIHTAGDNAPAIVAPGEDSVFNLEADGAAATSGLPAIATFGDNSAGILMHGAGSSTATLQFADMASMFGPALQTHGANSTLIDIELGMTSSASLSAENTSFGTFGDGSDVLSISLGDSSEFLVFLENSSLNSAGSDATLLLTQRGSSSSSNVVIIGSTLTALGDGSGGVVAQVITGNASSDTYFLADVTIETGGSDAPAVFIADGGTGSVRTFTLLDSGIATTGANSAGFHFGALGDGSAIDLTIEDMTISTAGANSPGLVTGSAGADSASSTSLQDIVISTQGGNSTALDLGGVVHDSSVVSVDIQDAVLSTVGEDSIGLVAHMLAGPGGGSTGILTAGQLSVSTLGARSDGVIIGDASIQAGAAPNIVASSIAFSLEGIDVGTSGAEADGLQLFGFGDGASISDFTLLATDITVQSGGDNAAGVVFDIFGQDWEESILTMAAQDIDVQTAGAGSAGIIVGDGQAPNGGGRVNSITVAMAALSIGTEGDDASALIVDPVGSGADSSVYTVVLNSIAASTAGDNAHGIVLGEGMGTSIAGMPEPTPAPPGQILSDLEDVTTEIGAGPLTVASQLTLGGLNVTTSGANAHALVIGENTTLTLSDSNIGATTLNGTVVSGTIDTFDNLVATGEGGRAVMNAGIIYDTFEIGAATTGNLANNGLIESAGGAGGVAVQYNGATDDIFELQPMGVVIGSVEAGAGTDTFILGGEGAQTFDQTLIGAQYNGFELFEKEDGSTWTLADLSATPLWEVKAGELVVQNEFIDPIARGFTVHDGATLTLTNTEPMGADSGADNRFEIHPGAVVNGDVFAGTGSDTFALGGDGMASFDVTLLDTKYNGFDAFLKEDASTWTLTGANTVAAPFLVAGGTLVNEAMLENVLMTVGAGGRLEGTGSVGGLTVEGTVAPGNSIGTLDVAGDVAFETGSTYEIEIAVPDQADLIAATGTATVDGGTLAIMKLDPDANYAEDQTYRIVEAMGGVVRNADFVHNQPFSLLRTDVIYGADFVELLLVADIPFTTLARTPNQFAAALGLQDLAQEGDALTVYNEIVQLSLGPDGEAAARRAFDLASGEIHAAGRHVIDRTVELFGRTLRQQGAAGPAGGDPMVGQLAYAAPARDAGRDFGGLAAASGATGPTRASAWLAPLAGRGTVEADGNSGALDWWTAGIVGGYERAIEVGQGAAWAGFGLGYLRSQGAVGARDSKVDADNFQLGVYSGWTDGPWRLTGALAYVASAVASEREVAFGGIDREAEADYWVHSVELSGEAAYGFDLGGGARLGPLATLDAGWSGHGGFEESGAGALNLEAEAESWTRLDSGLGVALTHTTRSGRGAVSFEVRALWEHAFAETEPSQDLELAGSPTGFTVSGPEAGRDRVRLGAGIAYRMDEALTVSARYDGLFSADQEGHTGSLAVDVKF